MILGHADVSNSHTHAQDLLQLELDGRLDFVDLGGEILVVGDGCWEFTSFGSLAVEMDRGDKAYPLKDQDLRDEGFA